LINLRIIKYFFKLSLKVFCWHVFSILLYSGSRDLRLFGLHGSEIWVTPSMFRQSLLWVLETYYLACAILSSFIEQLKICSGGEVTFPTRSVTFPRHLKRISFDWIIL
jgi:hypothetical protein